MAVIGNTYLTLADSFRRQGDDGVANIIEILSQINPILQDALAVECNDGASHLTTTRTGLPSGTWRKLYQGTQPTKSTTQQVKDATGMLEVWSELEPKLVELSGNPAAFRLSEAQAFLEGLSNDMATAIFYSNVSTMPESFQGLAPRFSSLGAENGSQIIDAGGTAGNNTSIWCITWGDNTTHLLYPKGSQAGLQRDDKGIQTVTRADGSILDLFREKFTWNMGMSVRDWRYVARVANIDVTTLSSNAAAGADLLDNLVTAYYRSRQRKAAGGTSVIYCNTTVKEFLHKQALSKSTNALRVSDQDGEEVVTFLGTPVRECEAILNTEARVV